MDRDSLDFLNPIFQNNSIQNHHILVVNQTQNGSVLKSDLPNVRVINSHEKGLSKSRNLAIENAIGDICLIADDDVVYVENFETIILSAFKRLKDPDMIQFKALNLIETPYKTYPNTSFQHSLKSIRGVMSIEIAFKREAIYTSKIRFNEWFGLGSKFQTGEEYIFSRNLIQHQLSVYFFNAFIVKHAEHNSGKLLSSNTIVYARAALNYCIFKNWAYIWVYKYVFFLYRNGYINKNELNAKIKIALQGISDFKSINNGE